MTRTVSVVVGSGHGADRQQAEVSVVNGHIWMTFLGPRGGRQYTLPQSGEGAIGLGRLLLGAAAATGHELDKTAKRLRSTYPRTIAIDRNHLVDAAHHKACIDHRHPFSTPCRGYEGANYVHTLSERDQ